ncbi:MAG: nicotinate-nucleotide adenylyltransferase [Pseudomonadota bacterium]
MRRAWRRAGAPLRTRAGGAHLPSGAGRPNLRIGLLGGSFNPAHDGHRHISLLALRILGLDEVWWLVSPQNPLKPAKETRPLQERLRRAREVARHPRIRVTDLEAGFETRYTIDSLRAILRALPRCRFVWLMGADNLAQISRWRDWTAIFDTVPIAVFDRPSYSFSASTGGAARRFGRSCLPERQASMLADMRPPAWVFLKTALNPVSATRIRKRHPARGIRAAARRYVGGGF